MKKCVVKAHTRNGKKVATHVRKTGGKAVRATHVVHGDISHYKKQLGQLKEYAKENNYPGKTKDNIKKMSSHLKGLHSEMKVSKADQKKRLGK